MFSKQTGQQPPETVQNLPVTGQHSPETDQQFPETGQHLPVTDQRPPETDQQSPVTGHHPPETGPEIPASGLQETIDRSPGVDETMSSEASSIASPLKIDMSITDPSPLSSSPSTSPSPVLSPLKHFHNQVKDAMSDDNALWCGIAVKGSVKLIDLKDKDKWPTFPNNKKNKKTLKLQLQSMEMKNLC